MLEGYRGWWNVWLREYMAEGINTLDTLLIPLSMENKYLTPEKIFLTANLENYNNKVLFLNWILILHFFSRQDINLRFSNKAILVLLIKHRCSFKFTLDYDKFLHSIIYDVIKSMENIQKFSFFFSQKGHFPSLSSKLHLKV